jgi:uncharacterized protein (DUF885 family)
MNDELAALAAAYHDFHSELHPTKAHLEGDYRWVDRFEQVSREAEDAEIAGDRDFARRAEAISLDGLTPDEAITREMLIWDANVRSDILESRLEEFSVDPVGGFQAALQVIPPMLSLPNATVAEQVIPKYHGVATYFRQTAQRHREGVANGRTPARFAVEQVVAQLDEMLAAPIDQDPLLNLGPTTDDVDREAWLAQVREVVEHDVRPALEAFRDTLRNEVLPAARTDERVGLTNVPGGDQAYARLVRFFTTVPLTPQEIHEIGLRQIESLAREYRQLGPEATGKTDLADILEALRSDPALHHQNAEDVVAASKAAFAKAKAAMPDWFGLLPKADCGVEATTSGALAYYFPPAQDGSRPGTFFMNTVVPSDWGRYQIEATSYHEGIPGHHLQLTIASELQGVPDFRKLMYLPAYDEGWGLYTERLADEMGLYSTSLDRVGMLCADSMRACRLVVDTGMHALGWSRQQAIDYMVANSPMTQGQVTREIDRYVCGPGQALAYMIGRLEIQRIRREAEGALGASFDIKAFHDTVLGSGPMPLPILDRHIRDWAAAG